MRSAVDPVLPRSPVAPEQAGSSRSEAPSEAPPEVESFDLGVEGMTCGACASRLERVLGRVPGVVDARVNYATERAAVDYRGGEVGLAELRRAVEDAGFGVREGREGDGEAGAEARAAAERRRLGIEALLAAAGSALVMALSMPHHVPGLHGLPPLLRVLGQVAVAALVVYGAGARFTRGAVASVRHRAPDMNTLVALGTTAAFVHGLATWARVGGAAQAEARGLYFDGAAMIVAFLLLGRWLEIRARHGAARSLRGLALLRPEQATLLRGGERIPVPAADLIPGDRVLVRPGERIPADGLVLDGRSAVDEQIVTGESIPVDKGPGDEVTGGTLNASGALTVRVRRAGRDGTLERILALVRAAQEEKAGLQRLADRVSAVFVPVVMGVAALAFTAWVAAGQPERGFFSAVAVLLVACPCALGLATPVAVLVGTGRGARLGLLLRGGDSLERAGAITDVVFDKTGTLTLGRPEVVSVHSLGPLPEGEVLALAAAVERSSEHPLAQAVVRAAASRGGIPEAEDFRSVPGGGVLATVAGRAVRIGSPRFLAAAGISGAEGVAAAADALAERGETPVAIAVDGRAVAVLGLQDRERPDAARAVAELRGMGLRIHLLSGDSRAAAQAVAARLGIHRVEAEVDPADKADRVRALRGEGRVVAMVGDGVNDAPALAAADLGIALGTGTDAARAAAGITLVQGDLTKVGRAIRLAKATVRTIRQNLAWAFVYNLVAIPVAAGALVPAFGIALDPAMAGAAMALSSLSVVLNSLRLGSAGS